MTTAQRDIAIVGVAESDVMGNVPNKSSLQHHAEAAHNLGVVLSQRGDVVRAMSQFLRAVEIKPEYGLAWENLGNSYLVTGDYLAAERSYRQAIAFRENSAGANYGLGTALIQQGKIDEGRSFRVAARR